MKKCLMKVIFSLFLFLIFGLYICQEIFYDGDNSTSVMEEKEREALYSTIQGFVGEWWNGSDLYPDPCGWTPIQGVSCDLYNGFWYVTSLKIGTVSDNSLNCSPNATFTHHLFELNYLNSLSFYNCFTSPNENPIKISTSIHWEKLSNNLETLEFRSNPGIIGDIANLGCLKNLRSLVLLENGFTGQLPTTIGDVVKLQKLVLSGNKFEGQIPASFGALSDLLIVDLSRNLLSGQLPFSFGGLISLLKLDLSHNFLEGKITKEIGNLKNLRVLDFSYNKFLGGLVGSFDKMVALEEMALSNNPMGGELNEIKWEKLQELKYLDLSNTGLVGNIPESLANMRSLRFIGLKGNNLSGNVSAAFETMPSLSAFYLQANYLTGKLSFSESFYSRMGSRFRASENENLCYSFELMGSGIVPFGVQPCKVENDGVVSDIMKKMRSDGDKTHDDNTRLVVSLGSSINDGDGYMWNFVLKKVVICVVCNMLF